MPTPPALSLRAYTSNSSFTSSRASEDADRRPERNRQHSGGDIITNGFRGLRRMQYKQDLEGQYIASVSKTTYNPPIDMRSLDYVAGCDTNLTCGICRCPFVDPVVLEPCDHCFCRDCIRTAWSGGSRFGLKGDCPTCRSSASLRDRGAVSKILRNILDEMRVRCPHQRDGCTAELNRGEVQDHCNIYCRYAWVECPQTGCELAVRRKDMGEGCLHYDVSCMDCRVTIFKSNLELDQTHWQKECPDRRIQCELCKRSVFFREMDNHTKRTCPATSFPCPGASIGCSWRSEREDLARHGSTCAFALLSPILTAQKERQDEQEAAQRQLSRKLEILEGGFSNLQSLLESKPDSDPYELEAYMPNEYETEARRAPPEPTMSSSSPDAFSFPLPPTSRLLSSTRSLSQRSHQPRPLEPQQSHQSSRPMPPADYDAFPFMSGSDMYAPTAQPSSNLAYTSPTQHLLSLHESLRSEVTRIGAAL
ncbi:hypothetical protein LTR66_015876, partial [Elasticomyces elasticus]